MYSMLTVTLLPGTTEQERLGIYLLVSSGIRRENIFNWRARWLLLEWYRRAELPEQSRWNKLHKSSSLRQIHEMKQNEHSSHLRFPLSVLFYCHSSLCQRVGNMWLTALQNNPVNPFYYNNSSPPNKINEAIKIIVACNKCLRV